MHIIQKCGEYRCSYPLRTVVSGREFVPMNRGDSLFETNCGELHIHPTCIYILLHVIRNELWLVVLRFLLRTVVNNKS